MGEFSLSHWILIAVLLLIFFGPSKLPQLGKSLGKAINGFKEGLNSKGDTEDVTPPNARLDNQTKQESAEKEKQKHSDHS